MSIRTTPSGEQVAHDAPSPEPFALFVPSARSGGAPSAPAPPRRGRLARTTLLAGPAVLAFVLGIWGIGRQGTLWLDEAVTYDMAHRGLPELWGTLGSVDAVHGLYYLVVFAVFQLWDGGLVALRLPSVLAAVAAVAGVSALGRALAGRYAGCAAGLVFALLPVVQRYAQEGRSYAMVTALVVWASWALVRACSSERPAGWWRLYAVLVAVAGVLHEFALLVVAAHGTTLLLSRSPGAVTGAVTKALPRALSRAPSRGTAKALPRALTRAWATAAGAAVVIVSPLVLLSLSQAHQVSWIDVSFGGDVRDAARDAAVALACVALLSRRGPALAPGAGRPPGLPPASDRPCRPIGLAPLALPLAVVPPVLLLLVSVVKPLYVDRYVLYSAAGLALLIGAAAASCWTRTGRGRPGAAEGRLLRPAVALVAVAGAVGALWPVGAELRTPASRSDDVTAVSRAAAGLGRPGDGLLLLPASRRMMTFGNTGRPLRLVDLALRESPAASHTLFGVEHPAPEIRERMLAAERIVVVREPGREAYEPGAREDAKRSTLREGFTRCLGRTVGKVEVALFARPGRC